jgi:hypothetical protein
MHAIFALSLVRCCVFNTRVYLPSLSLCRTSNSVKSFCNTESVRTTAPARRRAASVPSFAMVNILSATRRSSLALHEGH